MKYVHSTLRCHSYNDGDPGTLTQRFFYPIPILDTSAHAIRVSADSTTATRPAKSSSNFKALFKALETSDVASLFPGLTSFYSENREFEFSNLALRYYVDPPPGARLYSRWIRRPEEGLIRY
ncbi:hypothetical protein M378DRAFT_163200 [Amanita muscaria Koide BX008]|uniref:Uncharacterized protein n=1 Tax=Amanita muscaria (strain Koide BX008) TaxID=946122 RepID=A0A0C2SMH5_AMAMK|nr:hypothetical protein M378DRAFT_163200 [Amanita muscaria Koide BX008]